MPGAIGGGTTTANYLGESNYAADNTLKGKVKNFRIYNRALSAAEVADDLAHRRQPGRLGQLRARPRRPLGGHRQPHPARHRPAYGSTITWASSNPAVISAAGKVTRPGAGQPATVTLTATLTRGSATTPRPSPATVPPSDGDQAEADAAAAP